MLGGPRTSWDILGHPRTSYRRACFIIQELLRVSGSAASKVKHNCTAWRSHACDWLCPPYGKGAASAVGHRQWLCSGEHARNVLLRSRVSVVPVQLGEAHLITRQTAAVTFLGIPRAKRTTLLPARVFDIAALTPRSRRCSVLPGAEASTSRWQLHSHALS